MTELEILKFKRAEVVHSIITEIDVNAILYQEILELERQIEIESQRVTMFDILIDEYNNKLTSYRERSEMISILSDKYNDLNNQVKDIKEIIDITEKLESEVK